LVIPVEQHYIKHTDPDPAIRWLPGALLISGWPDPRSLYLLVFLHIFAGHCSGVRFLGSSV